MSPAAQLGCVMGVMFFSSLTRSTFGFGEALVAVPLLALILKVETASALVAICSVCNSFLIMATSRNSTDWRGAGWLIVSSLAGIPVGVYVLIHVPETLVKRLLASVVIGFALFSLTRFRKRNLSGDYWAIPFGFAGGLLGGAYNTSGPPLVIYGTLRGWTPEQFRATLQAVFLTNAFAILSMHYSAGLWSSDVVGYLWWVVPTLLLAVPLGFWLNRRIHPEHFQRWLYALLLGLGIMLVWSTM
jgi:uncharacterized membrane protein YfcA